LNLLYVAATRAKNKYVLNEKYVLSDIVKIFRETLELINSNKYNKKLYGDINDEFKILLLNQIITKVVNKTKQNKVKEKIKSTAGQAKTENTKKENILSIYEKIFKSKEAIKKNDSSEIIIN